MPRHSQPSLHPSARLSARIAVERYVWVSSDVESWLQAEAGEGVTLTDSWTLRRARAVG